jgi:hypothetical protein
MYFINLNTVQYVAGFVFFPVKIFNILHLFGTERNYSEHLFQFFNILTFFVYYRHSTVEYKTDSTVEYVQNRAADPLDSEPHQRDIYRYP